VGSDSVRNPPPPGPGTGRRLAVLYHRPFAAAYHGGSIHLRGFVERLSRAVPVVVVAPQERVGNRTDDAETADPLMTGFRYLVASSLGAVRFMLRDFLRRPADRCRGIVCFDIYLVGIGVFWSRLRGLPFVYYPQDSTTEVTRRWKEAGYRGGVLFRLTRAPLERIGLANARIVVVPSGAMQAAFEAEGVPPSRIRICTVKRSPPVRDPATIAGWRHRLELNGRRAVVFIGSFQYSPNVRAFEFLRDAVAPELLRTDPELSVVVAGLDSEPYISHRAANLRVLGTVADLDGLLFACSIGVAPMDVGGGTSGKIVDYVLHGLRVLATPEAAAGIEPTAQVEVAPRGDFATRLVEMARALRDHPVDPNDGCDAEFLRRYTESGDIDALGIELRRMVGL
jgi:hypothetical protein